MCLSLHAPYCMVLKFVGAETKKAPAIGFFRIASAKVRGQFELTIDTPKLFQNKICNKNTCL